jgi:hypothetical protein
VALVDTFHLDTRHLRLVAGWRADGTGVTDELVNRRVAEGIREAERRGLPEEAAAAEPVPPDALAEPVPPLASRAEAPQALRDQWKRHTLPSSMIRFLAAHGFSPDETGALFRDVFGVGPRHQTLASEWQRLGMRGNRQAFDRRMSEGIREAAPGAATADTDGDDE